MKLWNYFTKIEKTLWISSVVLITASFFGFSESDVLTLVASLVGVTALILNAKGNPIGPGLMMVFSIIYGIISYECAYYGEMITYVGMSLPMAVVSLVTWLRNPHNGNKAEAEVNRVSRKEIYFMLFLVLIVTVAFYFILGAFGTAHLIPSTISVTTSFAAAYLSFRRSPYYAFAYALNDVVLLVLWTLMAFVDVSYVSVIVCFVVFLVNDMYGFFSWKKREKIQKES
ncbi:MAG: nicotinamide mononucleotide transporter [Clostridia bacterium]|nr:nicotinamide mononucleotide transporter [Clostridia bacterium]